MPVRFALPVAVALTLGAVGGCSSTTAPQVAGESSSPAEVRPAQMAQPSQCDELIRRVEDGMPTAAAYRVPGAQADLRDAQELCHSGRSQEGIAMLRGVLADLHVEP
jgi:hypothetical protein